MIGAAAAAALYTAAAAAAAAAAAGWRSDNAPGGGGAHGAFDQRSARARVAPTSPLPLLPIPNCTGVRLL